MSTVDPYGEDRADLRHAVNTANVMASQAAEKPSDEDFRAIVNSLRDYLGRDKQKDEVDLNALERMKKRNGGNR